MPPGAAPSPNSNSPAARWHDLVLPLGMTLAPPLASSARADAVTDWNAIMQATVSTPPSNAVYQTRWGAITQLALET